MSMRFFPIRRPALGLHVGARALTVAEVGRDWLQGGYGCRVHRVQRWQVPQGLLRVSPVEKNILDVPGLAVYVRGLLGRRQGRCVALSLPDQCARIALFDFESLPQKPAQVDSLLRWRFQKDLSMAVGDARMPYRVFRPKPVPGQPAAKTVRVLAAAVREEVASQYEQMCEEAGAIPVAIGLSSLALLDACRASISPSSGNALFLHLTDTGFTFAAFQRWCPVFFRLKALYADPPPSAGTLGERLVQEVSATLHFYAERYLGSAHRLGTNAGPLYLVKGHEGLDPVLQESGRSLPELLLEGALAEPLNLKVVTLAWEALRVHCGKPEQSLPGSGLAAVAMLLAA
jgi:hypothetical protein